MFGELAEIGYEHGLLRGILVHLWFVWVHPVPDGNGRIARFLMNTALIGGGLPWLTIRVEQRDEYFATLHSAQLDEDFAPFARFMLRCATR
jgi:Fic family protein